MNVPTRAAEKYIRRIKHTAKREYAERYYRYILAGRTDDAEPDYNLNDLCYMAAQAVRMNLDEIYRGNIERPNIFKRSN